MDKKNINDAFTETFREIIEEFLGIQDIKEMSTEKLERKLATTCKQEDLYDEIVAELELRKTTLWKSMNE